MAKRRHRIPAFIPLPGPGKEFFVIRVQQVKGSTLHEDDLGDWDSATRVGRIPIDVPRKSKLLRFDHELGHALQDYRLWFLQQLGLKELC